MPRTLLRSDLIIIDDWTTAFLTDEERRGLFEVVEDRHDRRSTQIAARYPSNTGTTPSAIPGAPHPSAALLFFI